MTKKLSMPFLRQAGQVMQGLLDETEEDAKKFVLRDVAAAREYKDTVFANARQTLKDHRAQLTDFGEMMESLAAAATGSNQGPTLDEPSALPAPPPPPAVEQAPVVEVIEAKDVKTFPVTPVPELDGPAPKAEIKARPTKAPETASGGGGSSAGGVKGGGTDDFNTSTTVVRSPDARPFVQ